jgi:hypothetical protein
MTVQGDKIRSFNHEDYNYIVETLADISDLIKGLSDVVVADGAEYGVLLGIFDTFDRIDYLVSKILFLMSEQKYINLTKLKASVTFNNNPSLLVNQMGITLAKLRQKVASNDSEVIGAVLDKIDADKAYDAVTKSMPNRLANAMVTKLLDIVNPTKRAKLIERIEQQKNDSLESTRCKLTLPGIEGQLTSMNLIPAGLVEVMPTDRLIKINKSSKSPINFDVRGLLDQEFIAANGLTMSPNAGVNEKTLQKFNTTTNMGVTDIQPSMVEIIGDNTSDVWTVCDTINGRDWRYLTWNGKREVPRGIISPLLDGVNTRPTDYNRCHENIILEKCFDSKAELTTNQYLKHSQYTSSANVRAKLIDELSSWFGKEMAKLKQPNVKDIKEIDVASYVKDILQQLTGENTKLQKSAEFTLTYLMQYDAILTTVSKNIKFKWNATIISPTIFKDYTTQNAFASISNTLIALVNAQLDELDKNKTWTATGYSLKEFYLEYNYVY